MESSASENDSAVVGVMFWWLFSRISASLILKGSRDLGKEVVLHSLQRAGHILV